MQRCDAARYGTPDLRVEADANYRGQIEHGLDCDPHATRELRVAAVVAAAGDPDQSRSPDSRAIHRQYTADDA